MQAGVPPGVTRFLKRYFKPALDAPPVWLIAMVAGLPLFSETMYSPALPHIARAFEASGTLTAQTFAIYLFGTAVGTIFWGTLSDYSGRKSSLLGGFLLYTLGCAGCFFASSIGILLCMRLIQALGASVGTVLGQAICNDIFQGKRRRQVFSTVGTLLAIAPAVGPTVGGLIDQTLGWRLIFFVLMLWGTMMVALLVTKMPETHPKEKRTPPATKRLLKRMYKDPKVLVCGAAVGLSNGLFFSFNTEGPFYLINMLGVSPLSYGLCFTLLATMTAAGSYTSRYLHHFFDASFILKRGLYMMTVGTVLFALGTLFLWQTEQTMVYQLFLTLAAMAVLAFGRGLTIANCLALGLEDYVRVAGAATALFVCFYYLVITATTSLMGVLHNDTLYIMPAYFCFLGLLLLTLSFFVPSTLPQEEDHAAQSPH